jgi:hypothetical protein
MDEFFVSNHIANDGPRDFVFLDTDNITKEQKGLDIFYKRSTQGYFINIYFTTSKIKMICCYFPVRHETKFDVPTGLDKVLPSTSKDFLKYMVWLDYLQMNAERNGEMDEAERIKAWFNNFIKILREIYDCEELTLKYNAKELKHTIEMPDREPFGLNEMADGYSAFLDIVMDLMVKIESFNDGDYNTSGIVLIDEIEKHLHVELQKKVLPFLTTMFPNIQFIVTTHSPFVITSLSNAVVYDLEKHERLENLSAYSYDGIVEYYFDAQKYSDQAKANFEEYKMLVEKKEPSVSENDRLADLILYFNRVPTLGSPEIMNAFLELELKRGSRKNG